MKKQNLVSTICEIGIFAALGFVIDSLQGIIGKGLFVNGGSIGFALIVVIIIGLRKGILPAIFTGLIIGLLDFVTGPYIIHPVQPILDYIIPYALVAAGLALKPLYRKTDDKNKKILYLVLMVVVGGMAKFVSHYLAGVIFWADQEGFAWNLTYMNPYLYSFVYNIAYIGPSIVISSALLVLIYLKAPIILGERNETVKVETPTQKGTNYYGYIVSVLSVISGLYLFIYYLISYIKSIEDNGYGFDANGDSMLIFVLGIFLVVIGGFGLYKAVKHKQMNFRISFELTLVFLISFIYALARLIRMYVKSKDPTTYWIWVSIALTIYVVTLILTIYFKKKEKTKFEELF